MTTTTLAKTDKNGNAGHDRSQIRETFVPRFDFWETAEEYVLSGDLPGVSNEGLDIRFENGQLILHGKVAKRNEGRKALYSEYGIGDFHRSFSLGDAVDAASISAELSAGVLTIRLPKKEDAKPRKIEIKVA